MGLFDAFSSGGETKRFNTGHQLNRDWNLHGSRYGEDYTGRGVQALSDATGDALGQIGQARSDVTGYTNKAIGALDQGAGQAAGYIQQGIAPQQGLYDRGTAGIDLYTSLLNDPGSYSLTPGAQFQIDTGTEALNRAANSRGMLTSGNNTEDILRLAQGVASQDYYKNLAARQPYFGLAQSGAAGVQSGYNQLGGLYDQLGANKANVYSSGGNQLAGLGQSAANIEAGQGQSIADLYQRQGALGALTRQNIGASAKDTQENIATAEQLAEKASWEALLGFGNAVTGGIGSYVGAGGRFA